MRKGLPTLTFLFEGESRTHFGGRFLIQSFCNQLRLRRRLERILQPTPTWNDYPPGLCFEAHGQAFWHGSLPGDRRRATGDTIRQAFLVLPGKPTPHGSRKVLQLPKDYPHRQIFLEPARQIQTLRFPEPAPGEKFGLASKRK